MAPPRGYKKGYVKHPDTDEWVDPRILERERKEAEKKIIIEKLPKKRKKKDEPATKSVPDDREYAKVIISWKDAKGRPRTTQYVMASLEIHENIDDSFNGAKKETHIHLSLDGQVLEKI